MSIKGITQAAKNHLFSPPRNPPAVSLGKWHGWYISKDLDLRNNLGRLYLAYAHPFLDGNGRTIIVVANELAYRAGIGIDWSKTNKDDYLTALTEEINDPHKGRLDAYLAPYIGTAISHDQTTQAVSDLPGLGPIDAKQEQAVDDQAQG